MTIAFRVIDGITRPLKKDELSSEYFQRNPSVEKSVIGSPSRKSEIGAIPKGAPLGATGGIFNPRHNIDRLLSKASEEREKAKEKLREAESIQKVQNKTFIDEKNEQARKERLQETSESLERLKKAEKNATKEDKKEIEAAKKEIESVKWKIQNANLSGSSIEALKYQVALKGDREAAEILKAISKGDWNKAKKLAEKRDRRLNEAIALKSKIDSEEGKKIFNSLGFERNTKGQWIPTDKTPEIAAEYDIAITPQELTALQQTPVAGPPKITATEVEMLSNSEEGRRRLREWGYAAPTPNTYMDVKQPKQHRFGIGTSYVRGT